MKFLPYLAVWLVVVPRLCLAQCAKELQVLIPDTIGRMYTQFGYAMAVENQILLTSDIYNDSLEYYAGIAYVFELPGNGTGNLVATLTPSVPEEGLFFGYDLALHGDLIAISGEVTVEDVRHDKVFMYVKETGQHWATATETAIINLVEDDALDHVVEIAALAMNDEFLAVFYEDISSESGVSSTAFYVNLYDITDFSLVVQLSLPKDSGGSYGTSIGNDMVLADDYLAVGAEDFDNPLGAVHIFYYDATSGWDSDQRFTILSPSDKQYYLGLNLEIYDNDLFIANNQTESGTDLICQVFYFPHADLMNGITTAKRVFDFPTPSAGFNNALAVNEDYLIFRSYYTDSGVQGYKKDTDWSTGGTYFSMELPEVTEHFDNTGNLLLTDKELLLSAYGKGPDEQSRISMFYAPDGSIDQAVFSSTIAVFSHLATGDYFGAKVVASDSSLIVTAARDDDKAEYAGAVYHYRKNSNNLWEFNSKIYAPRLTGENLFGADLVLTDELLLISDPDFDSLNADGTTAIYGLGIVYQYRWDGSAWVLENQLFSPELDEISSTDNYPAARKYFGQKLAYYEGYLAVGQYNSNSSSYVGSIYLYKFDESGRTWSYQGALTPSKPAISMDFFGGIVAISESLIVGGRATAGISSFSTFGVNSLLVFEKPGDEWTDMHESAVLQTSGLASSALILNDTTILVGESLSRVLHLDIPKRVSEYRRPRGNWTGTLGAQRHLVPEAEDEEAFFGYSLFSNDSVLYVSRPSNDQLGSIHVYDMDDVLYGTDSTVYPSYAFTADTLGAVLDYFGVSIGGNSTGDLVVGASLADTESGYRSGKVYSYFDRVSIKHPPGRTMCMDADSLTLSGFPGYGIWRGAGIVDTLDGVFVAEAAGAGTHAISYTFEGCTAILLMTVLPVPTVLSTSPASSAICKGDTVELSLTFEDSSAYDTLQWYFRPENAAEFEWYAETADPVIRVSSAGDYYCHIVAACSVPDVYFEVSELSAQGNLNHEGTVSLCQEETLDLSVVSESEIESYSWYFSVAGNSFYPLSMDSLVSGLKESGFYFCEFTVQGCPYYTDTLQIIDVQMELILEEIPLICNEQSVSFRIIPAGGRLTLDGYELTEHIIDPEVWGNGDYELLYVIDTLTCSYSASEEVKIAITDWSELFIPNVFTPNGDGFNDEFLISFPGEVSDFRMTIVDRNGKELYHTTDPAFQWTGRGCSSGVYYWYLTFQDDCTDEPFTFKGFIQLLK